MNSPTLQDILEKYKIGRFISAILSEPRYFWSIVLLLYLTLVLVFEFLRSIGAEPHGDVKLYMRVIESIKQGILPYRDYEFEYPPYAIIWFLLPGLSTSLQGFKILFSIEILLIDVLVKVALIWLILCEKSKRLFLPVIIFSLGTAANHYFYLQRFDLIPAAITFSLLIAIYKEQYLASGILLVYGAGCKLYPILFLPPLIIILKKKNALKQFALGIFIGLLPLLILGLFVPWWRFLTFHTGRGLQAESIYSAILWLGKHLDIFNVKWTFLKAWVEVTGPAATALLPIAKIIFIATTLLSTIYSFWIAYKSSNITIPQLARILLIPLCAFVSFNIVLSPQFLIWLIVLAAIAALDRQVKYITLLTIAAVVTPIIYPGFNYGQGLGLTETVVLLCRNLILILAWIGFICEIKSYQNYTEYS